MNTIRFGRSVAGYACLVAMAAGATLSGGCATMFKGTRQSIHFESQPPGATVSVGGEVLGKTPCTVVVDKSRGRSVEFALDGFQPCTLSPALERKQCVDGHAWLNAGWILTGPGVIFGIVGAIVDTSNGSAFRWFDPLEVTLLPLGATPPPPATPVAPAVPAPAPPPPQPRSGMEPQTR